MAAQGIPTDNPAGAIAQAITAANQWNNGVPYGPFLVRGTFPGAPIWVSQRGDTPISFYQPFAFEFDGWPLGGVAQPQGAGTPQLAWSYSLAPLPGVPAAVQGVDTIWILDDHGSQNSQDLDYMWPTPPAGFQGLGTAFFNGPGGPPYAVVAESALEAGVTRAWWDDSGSHWSHNGDLQLVQLSLMNPPTPQLRFAPGVCLSDEAISDGNFGCRPWTLVADAPVLPVPGAGALPPGPFEGSVILAVAALPTLGMSSNLASLFQNGSGPFVYLAAVASWVELGFARPETPEVAITVGMAPDPAASLRALTNARCGARKGLWIPPNNGFVSVDLSSLLGVERIPGATADYGPFNVPVPGPVGAAYSESQLVVDLIPFNMSGFEGSTSWRFWTSGFHANQLQG